MDIYFQSGEFYGVSNGLLKSIIPPIIGGFLGGGFALLVYYLKDRSDKKNQNEKELREQSRIKLIERQDEIRRLEEQRKEDIELMRYFIISFNRIVQSISKQKENFKEYERLISNKTFKPLFFNKVFSFDLDSLKLIKDERTIKIFERIDRENKFLLNEYKTNLIHLDIILSSIDKYVEMFYKIQDNTLERFNLNYEQFCENIFDLLFNPQTKIENDKLMNFWLNKNSYYTDKCEKNTFLVYEVILLPMLEELKPLLLIPQYYKVFNLGITSASVIEHHIKNTEILKKQFIDLDNRLKEIEKYFNELKFTLEDYVNKCVKF